MCVCFFLLNQYSGYIVCVCVCVCMYVCVFKISTTVTLYVATRKGVTGCEHYYLILFSRLVNGPVTATLCARVRLYSDQFTLCAATRKSITSCEQKKDPYQALQMTP